MDFKQGNKSAFFNAHRQQMDKQSIPNTSKESLIMGSEPKETEPNEDSVMDNFVDLVYCFKQANEQAIVWHHQTDSFAAHKGLENFYTEIVGLVDGLVESVSGIYGRPKGFELSDPEDYKNIDQVKQYFKDLYTEIKTKRANTYQESWIQNQIDEVAQLTAETLYLLSFK